MIFRLLLSCLLAAVVSADVIDCFKGIPEADVNEDRVLEKEEFIVWVGLDCWEDSSLIDALFTSFACSDINCDGKDAALFLDDPMFSLASFCTVVTKAIDFSCIKQVSTTAPSHVSTTMTSPSPSAQPSLSPVTTAPTKSPTADPSLSPSAGPSTLAPSTAPTETIFDELFVNVVFVLEIQALATKTETGIDKVGNSTGNVTVDSIAESNASANATTGANETTAIDMGSNSTVTGEIENGNGATRRLLVLNETTDLIPWLTESMDELAGRLDSGDATFDVPSEVTVSPLESCLYCWEVTANLRLLNSTRSTANDFSGSIRAAIDNLTDMLNDAAPEGFQVDSARLPTQSPTMSPSKMLTHYPEKGSTSFPTVEFIEPLREDEDEDDRLISETLMWVLIGVGGSLFLLGGVFFYCNGCGKKKITEESDELEIDPEKGLTKGMDVSSQPLTPTTIVSENPSPQKSAGMDGTLVDEPKAKSVSDTSSSSSSKPAPTNSVAEKTSNCEETDPANAKSVSDISSSSSSKAARKTKDSDKLEVVDREKGLADGVDAPQQPVIPTTIVSAKPSPAKSVVIDGTNVDEANNKAASDTSSSSKATPTYSAAKKARRTSPAPPKKKRSFRNTKAVAHKPSKDTKIGISLLKQRGGIVVSKIEDDSIFARSPLKLDEPIVSINGSLCPFTINATVALLANTEGDITIITAPRPAPTRTNSGASQLSQTETAATAKKPSKNSSAGISLVKSKGYICVSRIERDGIFHNSGLKLYEPIVSINGKACPSTVKESAALVADAETYLTIVTASMSSMTSSTTEETFGEEFKVIGVKASKDSPIGISLAKRKGTIRVSKVSSNSIFAETDLQKYQKVLSINGTPCPSSVNDAVEILKEATGEVCIIVQQRLMNASE